MEDLKNHKPIFLKEEIKEEEQILKKVAPPQKQIKFKKEKKIMQDNLCATYKTNATNLVLLVEPTEILIVDNKPIRKEGRTITFRDNIFSTKRKEDIDFIENLECFGKMHKDIIITRIN